MVGIQGSDVISEELALAYSAHQPSMNVCGLWPFRICRAALDGYLSELRHTLDAPIYIGPGR